eukprot:gene19485-30030_t
MGAKQGDLSSIGSAFMTTGMQATELARAGDQLREMFAAQKSKGAKVVLSFTSNLISSGLREIFCELARSKMIDIVITTAGGVEEDFIKCLGPTVLGDFAMDGAQLRSKGLNRIANLLVPNNNYCHFEDWMKPILDAMKKEQDAGTVQWTPSRMIERLGKDIKDDTSFYNQCAVNGIPVFCPSLSDGSIGDMLFFNAVQHPGLILDTAGDLHLLNSALKGCPEVNVLCLGGGLPKYHSLQACKLSKVPLARFVLVNTGQHFDGSETGMSEEDDRAAGKIPAGCTVTRMHSEATIVFPIMLHLAVKD